MVGGPLITHIEKKWLLEQKRYLQLLYFLNNTLANIKTETKVKQRSVRYSGTLSEWSIAEMFHTQKRSRFIRRGQNSCTICVSECSKYNALVCRNCTEWTHSLGVGFTDDTFKKFTERDRHFYCPHCISTNNNTYNFTKSLQR